MSSDTNNLFNQETISKRRRFYNTKKKEKKKERGKINRNSRYQLNMGP